MLLCLYFSNYIFFLFYLPFFLVFFKDYIFSDFILIQFLFLHFFLFHTVDLCNFKKKFGRSKAVFATVFHGTALKVSGEHIPLCRR
jgi:hypothetical protein